MDLGSLELQIFVSLTVVLGGALVALICDYLKGNNEQLREHNIEMRVRWEEQERQRILAEFAATKKAQRKAERAARGGEVRRVGRAARREREAAEAMVEPVAAPAPPVAASPVEAPPAVATAPPPPPASPQAPPPPPAVIERPLTMPAMRLEEEIQRVASWNSPLLEQVILASRVPAVAPIAPAVAVQEIVLEPVEPEAPSLVDLRLPPSGALPSQVTPEVGHFLPESAIEIPRAGLRAEPPILEEEAPVFAMPAFLDDPEPPPPPPPPVPLPDNLIDISDLREEREELDEPIELPELVLPNGMHGSDIWEQLVARPNPVSGYVVVVRMDLNESPGAPAPESGELIDSLMNSFLRDGDFGSRISGNEWVFLYRHDDAGLNQRRVGMVAERLWDFKLRNITLTHLTFKWGAVDVKLEPLQDALDAARTRMNASHGLRRLPGAHAMGPRRVVNG